MLWQQNDSKNNFPPEHQWSFCSFVLQLCSKSWSTEWSKKRELHSLKSFSLPHKAFTPAVNKVKPSQRKWKPKTDSGRYKGNYIEHLWGSLMPVSHTLNRDRCWGSAHLHSWDSWHLWSCFHLLIRQIFKRVALATEKMTGNINKLLHGDILFSFKIHLTLKGI